MTSELKFNMLMFFLMIARLSLKDLLRRAVVQPRISTFPAGCKILGIATEKMHRVFNGAPIHNHAAETISFHRCAENLKVGESVRRLFF